jgi:glycosyltransferase involved in cell wall biosynthesis
LKILFVAPIPPPITGQSLAVEVLRDALAADNNNDILIVDLSKKGFHQGIDSFKRIIDVLKLFIEISRKKEYAEVIYLTISESLAGNIRDLIIYIICRKKLSSLVVHLHGGSIKRLIFDKYKFILKLNILFLKKIKAAIVLGDSHLPVFSNILPPSKVFTIANFAEDDYFLLPKEIVDKFNNVEIINVLFLSNLIYGKGYNELLDAYLELPDNLQQKIRIAYAGDFESNRDKELFLERINKIDNIIYHGVVTGNSKKKLLSEAHIFCLPTFLFEGQPISILEAYASGCVVLTTNSGGIVDIFKNNINGFELVVKNSRSITDILVKIVQDPKILHQIGLSNNRIAHDKYLKNIYLQKVERILKL